MRGLPSGSYAGRFTDLKALWRTWTVTRAFRQINAMMAISINRQYVDPILWQTGLLACTFVVTDWLGKTVPHVPQGALCASTTKPVCGAAGVCRLSIFHGCSLSFVLLFLLPAFSRDTTSPIFCISKVLGFIVVSLQLSTQLKPKYMILIQPTRNWHYGIIGLFKGI